ncbi:primosomal protein N' family DNA-binding protein [Microbacterium imperiale]|uniref:Probable replication restart protein PriA n=1 Tax=Microbacterium imperiale TaxID=33884 RepID=A0A9W6M2B5_9MICO|nr:primosomal protein N' [Microbacterium imperiale]MBP2419364.1 primosomal protein N' (replication factor Y) [Microbacterium imperiale]MDS0198766.1 primosomal protein N' [Microbacterium imperiale]BFE39706.1 primosomal protein N' [Microbacterium imperiale]GLJ79318.1 putative primosomal protein N' [Microbacterium imperiale]
MTARPTARVLIDSPLPQLDRLFDYVVPAALIETARPGVRVKVPLRTMGRTVEGYLVERGEESDADRPLSELEDVVSPVVVLPPGLYATARRAADRAAGSASDILRLVIPKRMVRAEKAWAAAPAPDAPAVTDDAVAWARSVTAQYPDLASAVTGGERVALDAPPRPGDVAPAWAELLAAIAVETLASGRSAVVVVPDHRDEAHVLGVLAGQVAESAVVRDDARRSGPERYASYLRLLADVPCIVVGNRSTVYAPAHDVGVVVIWDDGDPLLAEPLSPGVHARDAALVRQEVEGSALVFAGITRTTDVERLVALGWVRDIPARRRESPRVVLSATREGESRGTRVPSAAFAAAREALADGPVLVQVARPGYAPVLVCADCRTPARCAHCAGPLRARRPGAVPDCTWCGRSAPAWSCAACSSPRLRMASSGSERTADELGRAFPNTRVIVSDGEHQITHVDPKPALVIATRGAEPFVAGGYRAVILLDGDRMLMTEQLRIAEACLRWWSDAAALAAPGAPVHLVGVAGPAARALATWTQPAYARAELAERAPLHMPPVVRVAAVEGTAPAVSGALAQLRTDVPALSEAAVLGPVPREEATVRALVRFEYAQGRAVAESLRASVIAEALRGRRRRGAPPGPRNTLKVRLDVPDLDL